MVRNVEAGDSPIEIPLQYLDFTDVVRHCVISNLSTASLEMGTGVITASDNTVIDDSSFYNLLAPFKVNFAASIIVKQSTFKSCGSSFTSSGVTDGGGNCIVP
jgi:hypothetical protein